MPRKPAGTVKTDVLDDGTRAFRLRFPAYGRRERVTLHERRDCPCGSADCRGGGWTDATVQVELQNLLTRVQAGIWKPGATAPTAAAPPRRDPGQTFHEYASGWLTAKKTGALGDRISASTHDRLLSQLKHHLLPYFAKHRLSEIDRDLCLRFKAHKLQEADDLRDAIAAGADLRHRNGKRIIPLALSTIRQLIDVLAQILDDAIEDDHMPGPNPARGKRMRIKVPEPDRSFLEQDELALLLDAADEQDRASRPPTIPTGSTVGATATAVAALASQGLRPSDIAQRLGRSKATITYHLRRLNTTTPEPYTGRAAIVATLAYAGPRVSELCDIRIGQLRLHDPQGARFHIPDSKTPTGIRAVEISPKLLERLIDHIDRLQRAGLPTGPDAYAFPNTAGGRLDRGRAADLVHAGATTATAAAQQRGMPPLPHVTPHSLRRTYVSIALLSSKFDLKFVMAQVGHADSTMTIDVYNQLQQRAQRDHGQAFDAYIDDARDRLPEPTTAEEALEAWTS